MNYKFIFPDSLLISFINSDSEYTYLSMINIFDT